MAINAPYYVSIPSASVLFADLQGYRQFTLSTSEDRVLALLHKLYVSFDQLALRLQIEKIKTNGDEYMAICAHQRGARMQILCMSLFANQLLALVHRLNQRAELPCKLRVGITTGPLKAGFIGSSNCQFDVWGNTVNLAAALEQQATPGSALLCPTSYRCLAPFTAVTSLPFHLRAHHQLPFYELRLNPVPDTSAVTLAQDVVA